MPITDDFLQALKNPVVSWEHPENGLVKIINPNINLNRFNIEFDDVGTRSLKAYIYTPRLQIHSLGCEDDETNTHDLQFLLTLYGSQEIMAKYAYGVPLSESAVKKRVQYFTNEWQINHCPLSAFMCYSGDEQIGMFNLSPSSETPGVAEFAHISAPQHWKKSFASEIGLLLYKYPSMVNKLGYTAITAVTASARPDNGSAFVMDRLGLTCKGETERYGTLRKIFYDTVQDLETVVQDTKHRSKLFTSLKRLQAL